MGGDKSFPVVSVAQDGEQVMARLSAAERDVATLAASGLTNAGIAERRRTAVRTVANQMASILRKLGLGSRHDLAARIGLSSSRRQG